MKTMKRFRFSILVFSGLAASLLGWTSIALAGGLDPETIPGAGGEVVVDTSCLADAKQEGNDKTPEAAVHGCKRRIRTFDWNNWTLPRMEGDRICRERNGSLVCLTPESKVRLRW